MREIIKKLAEGIWVDDICAYCWAFRDDAHKPDCLVVQANVLLKMENEADIRRSFETIQTAILNDEQYAHGWHLNIAMAVYKTGINNDIANKIAASVMKELFEADTIYLCKEKNPMIYMKFDPETGIKIPNTTPELYRENHTGVAWLFNPWSGDKRDSRDIGSDVFGHLMVAPGESIKAMKE